MRRLFSGAQKRMVFAGIFAALVAGVWWQRDPLLSWYYLHGLANASATERASWIDQVVALDAAAAPGLIDLLRHDDSKVCANAEAGLAALVKRWSGSDARTVALADQLTDAFAALSQPGKEAALEWYLALLRHADGFRPVAEAGGKLLLLAAPAQDKALRLRTLALAEMLLARTRPQKLDLYRSLAVGGMTDKDADIRARAIRLTMHAPLHSEEALLQKVVPFLKDAAAEVRRAALLAVGVAEKTIAVDELLPLLQDGDAEVRRLCEGALKSRGLNDSLLKLAKLISDRRPGERLNVVHHLQEAENLDPGVGVWLQRLSQDDSPAVRAAAIRFAAEDPAGADFHDRLLDLSRNDPSATVRQLALHYLQAIQRRN